MNIKKLSFYFITFNMGYLSSDITDMKSTFISNIMKHDLLIIGLQESKNLNLVTQFNKIYSKKYVLLENIILWGICLLIYIDIKLVNYISNPNKFIKPLGFANILGNKGGLIYSFNLFHLKFCIINCHLAAGPGPRKNKFRINNVIDIFKSIKINNYDDIISYHDFVFFIGDLNFRINS